MKQEQMGLLNMLKLKQSFLTSKIRDNSQSSLTELTTINLKISQWYSDESEKITLMSRSEDIKLNEKVRIYHHGQHRQFRKRSSILKLLTAEGPVDGHKACASALEANVASHLLNPAPLDPLAQEILLAEVERCFTDNDISALEALPTKTEI